MWLLGLLGLFELLEMLVAALQAALACLANGAEEVRERAIESRIKFTNSTWIEHIFTLLYFVLITFPELLHE